MKKAEENRKRRRELVKRMYAGNEDLVGVAAGIKVDLGKLPEVADKKTVRVLRMLKALEDLRNEHFLNRYKAHAIQRLAQLLEQEKDPELARRSCVDLLKTDLRKAVKGRKKAAVRGEEEMEEEVDDATVLELLREIGGGGGNSKEGNPGLPEDGHPGLGEGHPGLGGRGEIHE